jgi:uncharacterized protein
MTNRIFEWNETKNIANQRKHNGIRFEEAAQVFNDPFHVSVQDRIEGGELRWRTTGLSGTFIVLVVAHTLTDWDDDGQEVEIVRIISARRADRSERQKYENENG